MKTFNQNIDKYESSMLTDAIPFSYIRIIDTRYDTTCIGFWYDGFLTMNDASQSMALQHVIDKYYRPFFTPGKDTLVIRIDKLMISDKISAEQSVDYTIGYLSCKEFTGSGNTYAYYGSFDTTMQEINSFESIFYRHKLGKHINYEYWDYYLLRLFDAMISCRSSSQDSVYASSLHYFTPEAIKKLGLLKRYEPVLNTKKPEPGFYKSFEEFKNNNPSVTVLDDTDLVQMLGIMHYNVGKNVNYVAPDTSYWGFCDGSNFYIRHHFSFYQLERRDGGFYIAPTLDVIRRDGNRFAWSALTGLTGLAAGIVTKEGLYLGGFDAFQPIDVPKIVIHQNDITLLGLELDWDTGGITY